MRKDKRREKGAQHKRPGRTARRVRQEEALERLQDTETMPSERVEREIASLKAKLHLP